MSTELYLLKLGVCRLSFWTVDLLSCKK